MDAATIRVKDALAVRLVDSCPEGEGAARNALDDGHSLPVGLLK